MIPVGYLRKYPDKLVGQRGACYDYVLASNGLFVEAEGPLFAARVPVSLCEVRGLSSIKPKMGLRYGKIPQRFFDLVLDSFLANPDKERYAAVTWDKGYHLVFPEQAATKEDLEEGESAGHGSSAGVAYLNPDSVILDIHSHGTMPPFWSSRDNKDETGLKFYAVVGHLRKTPQIRLRVGVYGYRDAISWQDIFEGSIPDIDDLGDEPVDLSEEDLGVSTKLLEEAYLDPGVPLALKEDISRELHDRFE